MTDSRSSGWLGRLAGLFGSARQAQVPAGKLVQAPPRTADAALERFVLKMPKVELHVHLEGAARPATWLELAKRNGVGLPATTEAELRRWFRFRDFDHFIEVFQTLSRCLRRPDDFRLLVYDLMAEQAIQNVLYTEAHFTIGTHAQNGGDPEAIRQALLEAVRDGEAHHGVRLRLIPDIVRDDAEHTAELTLDWARRGRDDDLVVALGLSGRETVSVEPLCAIYEAARQDGLAVTAHAGEHGDAEAIRGVLETIAPDRLDHGVRAIDDPELLGELVERRLPLTVCPTSNVALGVCEDHAAHPFDRLRRAGANLSVHTDDPQIFAVNLTREYLHLHSVFGYGAEELAALALAGVHQAFLTAEERSQLEGTLRDRFRHLGERHLGRAIELAPTPLQGRFPLTQSFLDTARRSR